MGKFPGKIGEYEIKEGETVASVCARNEITINGFEIRVNGDTVRPDHPLKEGDQIIIVKNIKGN
jgi:sulfur carrier protein ThiS